MSSVHSIKSGVFYDAVGPVSTNATASLDLHQIDVKFGFTTYYYYNYY